MRGHQCSLAAGQGVFLGYLMTVESAINVLIVAVLAALGFLLVIKLQAPKAKTQRLVMTVWAHFGPYDGAEFADKALRWAARAVFGEEGARLQDEWLTRHAENFRAREVDGSFERMQKLMRWGLLLCAHGSAFNSSCQLYRDIVMADVAPVIESLNKDLEQVGHKMEPVKQSDGSYRLLDTKILSDDEIEHKKRQVGEVFLSAIGNRLLEDKSPDAKHLLTFLGTVHEKFMGKPLENAINIGSTWLACLELQEKDPHSEMANAFHVLNEAWNITCRQIKTERIETNLSKEGFAQFAMKKVAEEIDKIFSSDKACSEFVGARVIRKQGSKVIGEFRDYMLKKVAEITSDSNPHVALRRALTEVAATYVLNSAFFWEEFADKRRKIYSELNAGGAELSDENSSVTAVWADAESLFLRILQKSMFEDISRFDWLSQYCSLYNDHVRCLYRAALARAEGKSTSLHAMMVKITKDSADKFKQAVFEAKE